MLIKEQELTNYLNELFGAKNWNIKHIEDAENITVKIWKTGEKIHFCYSSLVGWTKEKED